MKKFPVEMPSYQGSEEVEKCNNSQLSVNLRFLVSIAINCGDKGRLSKIV